MANNIIAALAGRLNSDILNPLVVKEMRQELRIKSFTISFLLPQIMMLFSAAVQLLETSDGSRELGLGASFFWLTLVLVLGFMIPRRGLVSFTKDSDPRSLEIVLLTGLSAWNVMVGKWIALALQSLLFVVAISPYVVLRYFLGDTNPVFTAEVILLMMVCSLFLSALAVSTSASGSRSRVLGSPFAAVIFFGYVFSYAYSTSLVTSRATFLSAYDYIVGVALGPIAILSILELGLTHIAPPLENYALRKRAMGGLCLGLCCVLVLAGVPFEGTMLAFPLVVMFPLFVSSLFETPHPGVARDIARGVRRRWQWLLYPGWPGGTVYTLAMSAACAMLLWWLGGFDINPLAVTVYLWGAVQIPQTILFLFPESFRTIFGYLVIQAVLLTFGGIFFSFNSYNLFSCFPVSVLSVMASGGHIGKVNPIVTISVSLTALLIVALRFQRFEASLTTQITPAAND